MKWKLIIALVFCIPLMPLTWRGLSMTGQNIPGNTNIRPGTTNVLVYKFRVNNSGAGQTNWNGYYYPYLFSTTFYNNGPLPSSNIAAVHFYYSTNGQFGADAIEARSANYCIPYLMRNFNADYSPTIFRADNYCYVGPDLGIHLSNNQQYFCYVTIDASTNLPDNTTMTVKCPGPYGTRWWGYYLEGGFDFDGNAGDVTISVTNILQLKTDVIATRLKVTSVPTIASKNVAFDVKLIAVDAYGNWDLDFTKTAQIYFVLTNVDPTPYSAAMGGVLHSSGSKANFTASITNTYVNECVISNAGMYQILAIDGSSSVTMATSSVIIVQPDIHHFDMFDQASNNIDGRSFTAGTPIFQSGVTNLLVIARDAVGNRFTGYSGTVYFSCDDPRRRYSIPFDGSMSNLTIAPASTGLTNIGGSNFVFYSTGQFALSVIDTNNGIKSDVRINIGAGAPSFFGITGLESYQARAPMKFTLSVYDQYTNVVSWFNGVFSLTMRWSNDNTLYTNFVISNGSNFLNGVYQGSATTGPFIRDPGTFILTLTLDGYPAVTTNLYARFTLNGDETALSVGNNFITPGSAIRVVEIFGQNKNPETISVVVTVYDSSGRRVKEFPPQDLPTGITTLSSWDLANTAGRQVAAGLYLIRIQPKDAAKQNILPPATKKVVVVR